MDTFLEMQTGLQSDLNIGTESTFPGLTEQKSYLNRAYIKAGALFRWPELEDAKKTSTENGINYYDYPDNWQPDSLWKIEIDSVRYGEEPNGSPIAYDDFLIFKEDEPNSTLKKWATQWRRYFVTPTPTANGNNNISVWGQKTVVQMSEDGDVTIFSYSMPECNEAVVLEAGAMIKAKGEEDDGKTFKSREALQILTTAFGKIRQNQAKFHKVQPSFEVSDMFGRNKGTTRIGNF